MTDLLTYVLLFWILILSLIVAFEKSRIDGLEGCMGAVERYFTNVDEDD